MLTIEHYCWDGGLAEIIKGVKQARELSGKLWARLQASAAEKSGGAGLMRAQKGLAPQRLRRQETGREGLRLQPLSSGADGVKAPAATRSRTRFPGQRLRQFRQRRPYHRAARGGAGGPARSGNAAAVPGATTARPACSPGPLPARSPPAAAPSLRAGSSRLPADGGESVRRCPSGLRPPRLGGGVRAPGLGALKSGRRQRQREAASAPGA